MLSQVTARCSKPKFPKKIIGVGFALNATKLVFFAFPFCLAGMTTASIPVIQYASRRIQFIQYQLKFLFLDGCLIIKYN
jgi:hypothetical protein